MVENLVIYLLYMFMGLVFGIVFDYVYYLYMYIFKFFLLIEIKFFQMLQVSLKFIVYIYV